MSQVVLMLTLIQKDSVTWYIGPKRIQRWSHKCSGTSILAAKVQDSTRAKDNSVWGGREVKPFPSEGKILQPRRVGRKAMNRCWYTWGINTVAGHLLDYLLWHTLTSGVGAGAPMWELHVAACGPPCKVHHALEVQPHGSPLQHP